MMKIIKHKTKFFSLLSPPFFLEFVNNLLWGGSGPKHKKGNRSLGTLELPETQTFLSDSFTIDTQNEKKMARRKLYLYFLSARKLP